MLFDVVLVVAADLSDRRDAFITLTMSVVFNLERPDTTQNKALLGCDGKISHPILNSAVRRFGLQGLPCEFQLLWPQPNRESAPTVGELLRDEMAANGWGGADAWAENADKIAPTLVGGSKKHGGADLGPTRAKKAWAELGVDGRGIVDQPPAEDFDGEMPRLTVKMAALVQGFPKDWDFSGRKTAAYRQVGNAFPPPVAKAVGTAIKEALDAE